MVRAGVAALAVAACTLAGGCGSQSAAPGGAVSTPPRVSAATIPGSPAAPRWLRTRIWAIAGGLGDPHPDKIAVTLNRHERGRIVDRVWMRGHFFCSGCVWTGPVHLRLVGYTFDAVTHDTISASGRG